MVALPETTRFLIADDDEIVSAFATPTKHVTCHVVNVGDRANFCDVRLVDRLHQTVCQMPVTGVYQIP